MGYLALEERMRKKHTTHNKSLDTIALTLRNEHPSDNQRIRVEKSKHTHTHKR